MIGVKQFGRRYADEYHEAQPYRVSHVLLAGTLHKCEHWLPEKSQIADHHCKQ